MTTNYQEIYQRSIKDAEGFWSEVANDILVAVKERRNFILRSVFAVAVAIFIFSIFLNIFIVKIIL